MRAIITPQQMGTLDNRTIEEVGLPGIVLMELAARGVMQDVEQLLGGRLAGARVLVVCGGGNNGGDGFAVARRLLNAGAEVRAALVADREKVEGDARTNLEIYERLGGAVLEVKEEGDLEGLPAADLIVDALLGTGIRGGARGLPARAIEAINAMPAPVVAVDIPSGIDGATGAAGGPAVQAALTSTFGEIKIGHLIPPGLDHAGRITRVDIQIPPRFLDDVEVPLYLIEGEDVHAMLPQRGRTAHKGEAGRVLLVAGSVGMTGAAQLAARSVLRTGGGMVKVATARNAQALVAGGSPEIMTVPVDDTEAGTIAPAAETTIDEAREWADVEVIGPGLSLNDETVAWFDEHAADLPLPTVIDADGLNALAKLPERLEGLGEHVVLTPHLGEFARLTGRSIDEIAADRVGAARDFAREKGLTLLLKGVPTLVASPEGPVLAVLAGNPGMASAGMGDVLTGVIAGLLAQGLHPREAAVAGATLHGLAGNLAADELGQTGIVAGDVAERLPLAHDILAGRAPYPAARRSGGCGCGGGGGSCGGGGCDCDGDCDGEGCGCGGH
jgi:NAD(P)H-hydrate epimerase